MKVMIMDNVPPGSAASVVAQPLSIELSTSFTDLESVLLQLPPMRLNSTS